MLTVAAQRRARFAGDEEIGGGANRITVALGFPSRSGECGASTVSATMWRSRTRGRRRRGVLDGAGDEERRGFGSAEKNSDSRRLRKREGEIFEGFWCGGERAPRAHLYSGRGGAERLVAYERSTRSPAEIGRFGRRKERIEAGVDAAMKGGFNAPNRARSGGEIRGVDEVLACGHGAGCSGCGGRNRGGRRWLAGPHGGEGRRLARGTGRRERKGGAGWAGWAGKKMRWAAQ